MTVYKLRHKESGKYLKRAYKGGGWSLTKNGTIFERLPSESRFNTYSISKIHSFGDFEIVEFSLVEHVSSEEEQVWVLTSGTSFSKGEKLYHIIWEDCLQDFRSYSYVGRETVDSLLNSIKNTK